MRPIADSITATTTLWRMITRDNGSAISTCAATTTAQPALDSVARRNPSTSGAATTTPMALTVASAVPHPAEPTHTGPRTATPSAMVPAGPTGRCVWIAGQVEDGAVVLGEDGFGVWVLMLGVQGFGWGGRLEGQAVVSLTACRAEDSSTMPVLAA